MLLKNTATTSQTVQLTDAGAETTVLPGAVVDVPEYDQAKEIMGMNSNFSAVSYGDDLRQTKVTLTAAEVKALNTTPKAIIATPGAGYAIAVEKAIVTLDYGTAAYATNTDLEIRYDGAAAGDGTGAEVTMASFDAILLLTADAVATCSGLGQADETALTINKGVSAIVATGDPATGDSPVTITVRYRIVSVA